MSTFLVTGSAGFIGYHVTLALLEQGHTVIGIDSLNHYYEVNLKLARNQRLQRFDTYSFFEGDISDESFVEKILSAHSVESICHLAAQAGVRYSLEQPLAYEQSNIRGTLVLFESARKHNVHHIVYASSSSVYGNSDMPETGFVETQPVDTPISLYAATKKSDELMAYTYHHLFGIHMTGLRFFTVYGPWGRPDMAYFSFTKALLEQKPIRLNNNGDMYRDFTHISDIVRGVIAALEKPMGYEIFNLGNSQPEHLRTFLGFLEKATGRTADLIDVSLPPGDMLKTFANTDKARELLQWQPQTHIQTGLTEFVQWYKEYYGIS